MLQVIPTGCPFDCGGSCTLLAYVEDGVLKRIGPDEAREDTPECPQLRPCARGLAAVQRVYSPERLLYPLKRTGERGSGSFARVSWDEALDEVARQLRRVVDTSGPAAILNLSGSGNTDGRLHQTTAAIARLLNMLGGQTMSSHIVSFEGAIFASQHAYGAIAVEEERAELPQSRLVIAWGCNPAESIAATNTCWFMARAKENGTRFVFVDPRLSESAAALADQWIPIRPATDTAMMIAMAYVMIAERIYDWEFVNRFVYGFEEFRAYCLGVKDGIRKTPSWAEAITGVPAETIASLARQYATTKPACLKAGWAPGRAAFGEQFHRAAIALAAITGNVGRPGGGAGVWLPDGFSNNPYFGVGFLPKGYNAAGSRFPAYRWADAVLRGKDGGYPADIKMIYCVGGNKLNQYADVNKGIAALKSVEFTVVHEQFMTPTARYADIVLPAQTHLERNDVQVPHGTGNYLIFSNKVIEPLGECKSDLEICSLLAERLGLQDYNDRSEEAWLRSFVERTPVGDYDEFRTAGVRKFVPTSPRVPFLDQVQNPNEHPFPTPTGKIEILSTHIRQGLESDLLPAIPRYVPPSATDHESRYPLRLISAHSRKRCNSTFANLPWLRELEREGVWVNPADAEIRSIRDGDLVKVYNAIGTIILPARVTQRIMPGVVNVYQGNWYDPDEHGNDRGGCVNVLTRGDVSPGGAAVMNGIPVQIERSV